MGSPVTKAEAEQTARGMDADTFRLLREFIYEQTGITFQENQKYLLESRLAVRLKEHKLATYAEYLNYLRFDTYRDRELVSLYGLITTNETYFYRDQPQLDAFLKAVIPAVMAANKASRQLRIWSAACSSGDEPYTLALMLSDYAPLVNWNIEILATDISEPILKLAQAGVYTGHALRHVPPHLKSRHFNAQGEHFAISQAIKSRVKFMNLNLYDRPRLKLVRGMDAELGDTLGAIDYSSSVTLSLIYRASDFDGMRAGFGFLVPKKERERLAACTFVGTKFSYRVPDNSIALRCFFGGTGDEAVLRESDENLVAIARAELQRILGLTVAPVDSVIARWPRSMAQYTVGHGKRIKDIRARAAGIPGLYLAGNAYEGIGIPDCIRTGRAAAKAIIG